MSSTTIDTTRSRPGSQSLSAVFVHSRHYGSALFRSFELGSSSTCGLSASKKVSRHTGIGEHDQLSSERQDREIVPRMEGGRRKTSMRNNQAWQWPALLFFLAGGLTGFGLLAFDVFFIFIPCVMLGLGLAIFASKRWGNHLLWVAVLGFGTVPVLLLLFDIISSFPPCPPGGLSIPADAPVGTTVSCSGPLPAAYYLLLACFGMVVLGAVAWPLLRRRVHR